MAASIEKQKELVLLLTRHQRQILAYIYTLIPRRDLAEDVLQQTSLVICEKFDQFATGSDFVAWACQIAWWEVRKVRLQHARSRVILDDTLIESLSGESIAMAPELDKRRMALSVCLSRLNERDREMLLNRYRPGGSVEEAAEKARRNLQAAYKALSRLRKLLHDCVTSQLLAGGGS
jgi:RNA polymerase sigma-70 factor, ECF subfamily